MPDYMSMENPYANVRSRTRKESVLIEEIEQDIQKSREHNEQLKNTKPITGPLVRFCPLDESPLKPIKPKPVEGLPDISKPRYKCTLCKSVFEGYGLDLYHESKKNLKAIVFPLEDVRIG